MLQEFIKQVADDLNDPVHLALMVSPVALKSGTTLDVLTILELASSTSSQKEIHLAVMITCPHTREPIEIHSSSLRPNKLIKNIIGQLSNHPKDEYRPLGFNFDVVKFAVVNKLITDKDLVCYLYSTTDDQIKALIDPSNNYTLAHLAAENGYAAALQALNTINRKLLMATLPGGYTPAHLAAASAKQVE